MRSEAELLSQMRKLAPKPNVNPMKDFKNLYSMENKMQQLILTISSNTSGSFAESH